MGLMLRAGSLALLSVAINLPAQEKPWSTEEIHGPKLPFRLALEEGTWMSVDVSPDGKTIVFDLLGDLFTLPITGGTATRLTSGPAWDVTPRFSPDGSRVVFLSDRAGPDHVWVVATAGGTANFWRISLAEARTHGPPKRVA